MVTGDTLGPYRVLDKLGEGGMGQVWRARDTKLDRDVAIKVLPEAFARDADRLARFTREAKTLAALNHPNIAAIYGLEESGSSTPATRSGQAGSGQAGITALVMELVEGEDLSERISAAHRRSPTAHGLPLDEALPIAKQVAEALEAAHEQGIVHRDLKPANIKVRSDGTVKVLDFGLAKAMDPLAASSPEAMNSPTITTPVMTQAGMILGTAAYMSPEQARGKVVDKRADIWAFGAVLFEMLTGAKAFAGDDVADVMSRVLQREPDLATLPPATPARVRSLVARCLVKDPRQRVRDMGDVRLALDGAFETSVSPVTTSGSSAAPGVRFRRTRPTMPSVRQPLPDIPVQPRAGNRAQQRDPHGAIAGANLREQRTRARAREGPAETEDQPAVDLPQVERLVLNHDRLASHLLVRRFADKRTARHVLQVNRCLHTSFPCPATSRAESRRP